MFADQRILWVLASVLLLPASSPLKESRWTHELEDAVSTTQTLWRLQVLDFWQPLGLLTSPALPCHPGVQKWQAAVYLAPFPTQKPVAKDVPGGAVDKQQDLIQDFLLELRLLFFWLITKVGGNLATPSRNSSFGSSSPFPQSDRRRTMESRMCRSPWCYFYWWPTLTLTLPNFLNSWGQATFPLRAWSWDGTYVTLGFPLWCVFICHSHTKSTSEISCTYHQNISYLCSWA